MEYGVIGLIILIIDIYAIYNVLTSGATGLAKILWTLGILIFPIVGALVWFLAGPRGGRA